MFATIFENVDIALKVICKFFFYIDLVETFILFLCCLSGDEEYLVLTAWGIGTAIGILPLYAFAEILTQLKLLNEKKED